MYSFLRSELWHYENKTFAKFRLFKPDGKMFTWTRKEDTFYKQRVNNKTTFVTIVKLE